MALTRAPDSANRTSSVLKLLCFKKLVAMVVKMEERVASEELGRDIKVK